MDTINSILHFVRPNMFLAKLDIEDAYNSISTEEPHQKLLKFKFEGKFTKLLKLPLATLRIQWKILVASYIHDLITLNMTHPWIIESCMHNNSTIMKMLMS